MRLQEKIAIIIGAGQSPGETIGNGRATALRFAQEGATRALRGPRPRPRPRRPRRHARRGRQRASPSQADVTREADAGGRDGRGACGFGRMDMLHYNVGVSLAGGDAPPTEITEEAFDRVTAINLRGCVMAVKHVLPVMRAQQVRRDPDDLLARGWSRAIPTSPTRRPRRR